VADLINGQVVRPKTLTERLTDHMLSTAVGQRDLVLPQIERVAHSMTIPQKIQMETEMRMRERERAAEDAGYDPCAVR
jgi:hypothetical protein